MKSQKLTTEFQHISPAGAEVRVLMSNPMASITHCTLKNGITSKAIVHKTVNEIWHVISGSGEIWRRQNGIDSITKLNVGLTIDIPQGTDFQYRSTDGDNLVFMCVTTPPWPGADEVNYLSIGAWEPSI
jgi:mannose-6-phosphate isomerase-like protein (cupin superfamily)